MNEKTKIKSMAKAAGLKSTFFVGDEVLMTSFGNGNEAILEKRINGDEIEDVNSNFTVNRENKKFNISGRVSAKADDPKYKFRKKPGEDMIHAKSFLEEKYFGKKFEDDNIDDNIHIQIAYNVMDIEKIMSIHINNILYSLNNVLNRGDENASDIIGMMASKPFENFKNTDKYTAFSDDVKKKQLSYFGTAFFDTGFNLKGNKCKTGRKSEEDIYYIIATLAAIRQFLAHELDRNRKVKKPENPEETSQVILYTYGEEFDDLYTGAVKLFRERSRKVLDDLYKARIKSLNDSFLENAKKDLTIIFNAYNVKDDNKKCKFIRLYYDFLVRKEYKYSGLSIKEIREKIKLIYPDITQKKYDTMRPRLNRLIDFVVYKHYIDNPQKAEKLVEKLRMNRDEKQKEPIYEKETENLWRSIQNVIKNNILPQMDGRTLANMRVDSYIGEISLSDLQKDSNWKVIDEKSNYFSKLVYLMTLFLDGKEINDLVTTLINKFENIESFNSVLEKIDNKAEYNKEYSIFKDSKAISQELRTLNSFARMEKPDASAKPIMFAEAVRMLGDTTDEAELLEFYNNALKSDADKSVKGFRNFIRNNVVDSQRFKYLIRYCNVEDVQAFAKNPNLVKFVMQDIPDAQILRYYKSCINGIVQCPDNMRTELSKLITEMSVEGFKEVNQGAKRNSSEEKDKLKKQNVIRLYLAVCYMFFKNLIYVNSRYFLAFYCLERDMSLYKKGKPGYGKYNDLVKKFLNEKKIRSTGKKKRIKEADGKWKYIPDPDEGHIPAAYLKTNIDNADEYLIGQFRNSCEHLNAVRKASKYLNDIESAESYYEIYHYLVQRMLADDAECDKLENPEKSKEYFNKVKKHNSYCKDFVKALCAPFGYNLPRFKNLSIDGLFDMHDERENRDIGMDA